MALGGGVAGHQGHADQIKPDQRSGEEERMQCEECQTTLWKAGEMAPAGRYIRLGDASGRVLVLEQPGVLPAAFDGHIALYHQAGFLCACMQPGAEDLLLSQVDGEGSREQGADSPGQMSRERTSQ